MTIWIDAQFPPALATWIKEEFGIEAKAVRDLGLRDAKDRKIFAAARQAEAAVMTKDQDVSASHLPHIKPAFNIFKSERLS